MHLHFPLLASRTLVNITLALGLSWPVVASAQLPSFQHQLVLNGIYSPTSMALLPDGRMLVATLNGQVFISSQLNQPPVTLGPYMDLVNINFSAEHGLIEILLDPDFSNNNYFYLYYSTFDNKNRVSRFTHLGNTASVGSELVLWQTNVPFIDCCHTGGAMCITNDNKILLAVGDDFNPALAQDLSSPFGKVHRFGLDGSVPITNPYYDATPGLFNANGVLKTIHSTGLRSPFRGAYDPVTDRFFISEVGGNDIDMSWEDMHLATPAANYGWPFCGDGGRNAVGACSDPAYSDPVFAYQHGGEGASIMAGVVYHGSMFGAAYQNKFFYADYVRGWIRFLTFDANGAVVADQPFVDPDVMGGVEPKSVVKLAVAPDGSLYYISIFDNLIDFTGSIHRIYTSTNQSPICGAISATPSSGPGPNLNVQLNAGATDPEGQPITYTWTLGDGTPTLNGASVNHLYTGQGMYTAQVVVSDGNTSTVCPSVQVIVGVPPTVQITSPANGSFFHAGDVIEFTASANDDNPIPPGNYTWTVVFNHDQHIHPEGGGTGLNTYDLIVPNTGHGFSGNTWYTVSVTVTDSHGLQATASIAVFPEKVNVLVGSVPSGLDVLIEGIPMTTPFVIDQAIGSNMLISAPFGEQCVNGVSYTFGSWSDAGPMTHQYPVPVGGGNLTATFNDNGACGTCGQAMVFDGVDDLVSINAPFTVVSDFTIEFWLNADAGMTDADCIIGNNSDFSIDLKNGRIHFYKVADRLTGSQVIAPGTWHHFAITRAGNALKLFVDGVQDVAATATPFTGTMWVYFLGEGLIPGKLGGALDEVRVWNHARSAALLQQFKGLRINPASTGLSAYWAFDEDPAQQAVSDASANGRNGVRGASSSAGADDPQLFATTGPQQFACPRWGMLELTALLQGPYQQATGLMKDDMRAAGLVPLAEPYTDLGFDRAGISGEFTVPGMLSITGPNAIVDWVLVELRAASDPTNILYTTAALLQRDGDVVAADGSWPLQVPVEQPTYHVAVRHRNHFGAMTALPMAFGTAPVVVDLTSTGQACFGTNARYNASGVLLLWAGNTILDPDLKYVGSMNDRDPILIAIGGTVPTAVVAGYSQNDTNLDGLIKYTGASNDRDPILQNIGGSIPTAVRQEQLP